MLTTMRTSRLFFYFLEFEFRTLPKNKPTALLPTIQISSSLWPYSVEQTVFKIDEFRGDAFPSFRQNHRRDNPLISNTDSSTLYGHIELEI
jgi:hypothetical protein